MPARCCSRRSPTRYARRHADDPRFTFGTGKLGDLAGFTSAIILAMIALLIGYEAVARLFAPVPIHFARGHPDRLPRPAVNIASAWLLERRRSSCHGMATAMRMATAHGHDHDEAQRIATRRRRASMLEIFEDGVPPRFRLRAETGAALSRREASVETVRPDGARQVFAIRRSGRLSGIGRGNPRAARIHRAACGSTAASYRRRLRGTRARRTARRQRDNNMRAAFIHVIADAAVSVLVIVGLLLARAVRLAVDGPAGRHRRRLVIASWSYGADPRHRRHPARHEPRPAAWPTIRARSIESATATRSPICISGGSAPAISAPSSRSRPRRARAGLLPRQLARVSLPVASDDRGPARRMTGPGHPLKRPRVARRLAKSARRGRQSTPIDRKTAARDKFTAKTLMLRRSRKFDRIKIDKFHNRPLGCDGTVVCIWQKCASKARAARG